MHPPLYSWFPTLSTIYGSTIAPLHGQLPLTSVVPQTTKPAYGFPPNNSVGFVWGQANNADIPSEYSVACWVAWNSPSGTRTILRLKNGETVLGTVINERSGSANRINAQCGHAFVTDFAAEYATVAWHHLAINLLADSVEVYLDGVLKTGVATSGTALSGVDCIDFGLTPGGLRFGAAQIAAPLTPGDVANLWNNGNGYKDPHRYRSPLALP